MTRPTDDELEAMAAKLIHGFDTLSEAEGAMDEAAAMLRACKGWVRVKALEWEQARDGAGWHPQLTIAYCPVFEKRFYAEHPEKQARIDAAREARIMSALEPDPDLCTPTDERVTRLVDAVKAMPDDWCCEDDCAPCEELRAALRDMGVTE